jgi:hypothetical protein
MISGRAISCELDENGNIKVGAEYTLTDGTKVTGFTRYDCIGFSKELLAADIKAHCETLMRKIYNLKQNQALVNTDVTDVTYSCETMETVVVPQKKDYITGEVTQEQISITISDRDDAMPIKDAIAQAKADKIANG